MALEVRGWTRAELARLPDDGNRYELVDGELFVTPAPSVAHQRIVERLSSLITPFVAAEGIGVVHHPRSVMVDDDDSEVEPDLMVLPPVAFDEWDDAPTPLLVVEVLSAVTKQRDLNAKRRFYMKKGVAEYWIVDREARCIIRVWPSATESISTQLVWAPGGTARELAIDVSALFRAP